MKYNPKLRRSTRSTKAYNNKTYLNSREARSIRIQCEMEEPRMRMKRLGVDHLVTFFGSARSKPGEPDYEKVYNLSRKIAEWCNNYTNIAISSGGGPGMMEAVNKGAFDVNCPSVGMGISLPFEQRNNEFISTDLDFEFHYFFTRKYWCTYLTKGFLAVPGGFGTMDEIFEILTLIQTDKLNKTLPIVLFDEDFWNTTINFQSLVDRGTISASDLDLFLITSDEKKAVDHITTNIEQNYNLILRE